MLLLHSVIIFLSAFLLFQVQPIIARIILPWFGGSAAVWTTCLLFFQVVLLLGYAYAHGLVRWLKPAAQRRVHAGLLGISLFVIPWTPREGWKPSGVGEPTVGILGLLLVTVGLPYFLLSTTGPLLQAWYAGSGRWRGGEDGEAAAPRYPYWLYSVSNAGSMLALLTYPVLVEPQLGSRGQLLSWSAGYALFALLCGWLAYRSRREIDISVAGTEPSPGDAPPGWALHVLWTALAACSSVLLMAVTNHLSQDVAAIPFLWVLPLSLYLLSFIICFAGPSWRWSIPYLPLPAMALTATAYVLSPTFPQYGVRTVVPLLAGGLFFCCLICHGELARLKPAPAYLTSFYLTLSLGGALGGFFVAGLAPHLFTGFYELPLGLAACVLLTALLVYREPGRRWRPACLIPVLPALALLGQHGAHLHSSRAGRRVTVRNFYGVLGVAEYTSEGSADRVRALLNGTINHGTQFLSPEKRLVPTTYYGHRTGVALAIRAAAAKPGARVGVIGLGTGTLAAYGKPGDTYRFYDINPLVVRLATTEFTYLRHTRATVEVALGDARLSLEREPPQRFDVLAVDAFSSDSIPVHLLTREAFELYFRHLKETGILAVHVSNKHLDLKPVVARAAKELGKEARLVSNATNPATGEFTAQWVLVANHRERLEGPILTGSTTPVSFGPRFRLWTDDYSNLFQILQ